MPSTPLYVLPYPAGSDTVDVPRDVQALATATETAVSALNAAGPYLSRPTAATAKAGGIYYATDTLGTFRSNGSAWTLIAQGAPSITSAVMDAAPFTTPYDGQIVDLLTDVSAGVVWRFKYRSASASAYKWEFVGGPPLIADDLTDPGAISSTTYVLVNPSVTVPRTGDYDVVFDVFPSPVAGTSALASLKFSAAAPSDNDCVCAYGGPGVAAASVSHRRRLTGLPASQQIQMYARVSGGSSSFTRRTLAVTPLRVS